MAMLILRSENSPIVDSPGKWRAGEIVATVLDTHEFGFREMPIKSIGVRSVAEINATPIGNIPRYGGVKLEDSGTVTVGTTPVDVVANDVLVWQNGGYFTNFGNRTVVPNYFYHIDVTDKTLAEVEQYLEEFNKKLSYSNDNYNPGTGVRLFTTTNVRVSASGNNGFTADGINAAIAEWNTDHPSNVVTLQDTDNLTYFQCQGIMPVELFDEWQDNSQRVALQDYYRRRRWYITQAGLDALEANDGFLQGPASTIGTYLRDGLLD